MELEPDVQLGKLFIIIWMCGMLFVIILFIYVYLNARNEASDCEPKEIKNRKSEKSEEKSDSPILKIIIVFLVITVVAVSTMNLTYKVNYFTKKAIKPPPSPSQLLQMMQQLKKDSPNPSAPVSE